MIINAGAILAFVNVCLGFARDQKYHNNENDTLLDLFVKTMDISDYKVPAVDSLGWNNKNFLAQTKQSKL